MFRRRVARSWGSVGIACALALVPLGCALSHEMARPSEIVAETVRFDASGIVSPVLSRVAMTPEQAAAARVFVPEGTRAFLAGEPGDDRPDTLAWYSTETNRLVAAIRIDPAEAAAATREGVAVTSGPMDGGRAAAIVAVSSGDSIPALLTPDGDVTLRADDGSRLAADAAPLLSVKGSSILRALTGPVDPAFHGAQSYGVRAACPDGTYSENLRAEGGSPLIAPGAAFTKTGVPTSIVFRNAGAADALVTYRLPPQVRKVEPSPDTILVPAGDESRVSVIAARVGNHPVPYEAIGVQPVRRNKVAGPAGGIAVTDRDGAYNATFVSGQPVGPVGVAGRAGGVQDA